VESDRKRPARQCDGSQNNRKMDNAPALADQRPSAARKCRSETAIFSSGHSLRHAYKPTRQEISGRSGRSQLQQIEAVIHQVTSPRFVCKIRAMQISVGTGAMPVIRETKSVGARRRSVRRKAQIAVRQGWRRGENAIIRRVPNCRDRRVGRRMRKSAQSMDEIYL
jgi:hypothetical protein